MVLVVTTWISSVTNIENQTRKNAKLEADNNRLEGLLEFGLKHDSTVFSKVIHKGIN
jgi:hypothetical protein